MLILSPPLTPLSTPEAQALETCSKARRWCSFLQRIFPAYNAPKPWLYDFSPVVVSPINLTATLDSWDPAPEPDIQPDLPITESSSNIPCVPSITNKFIISSPIISANPTTITNTLSIQQPSAETEPPSFPILPEFPCSSTYNIQLLDASFSVPTYPISSKNYTKFKKHHSSSKRNHNRSHSQH
jgi:hypothetical protein